MLEELEKKINLIFKNKKLLLEALTHRSYLNENPKWSVGNNERLEYLGDAVLELAVTEFLFLKYPKYNEGKLTMLRAALVNYQNLAKIARQINLDKFILTSKGEKKDIAKAWDVILANAFEALIGAIYLDQGFEIAQKFIKKFVIKTLDEVLKNKSYKDAKSELQEIIQEKLKITPKYEVLEESGPAHKKVFKVGVFFGDKLINQGIGGSKQEAEMQAAEKVLKSLNDLNLKKQK
ncbi:MAG: ribonuclease 3 [Candidatus Parcubacteria bacterium]|nr:MAG: ribonuclease 3 [Candidatus Parcubacteria bacterium]